MSQLEGISELLKKCDEEAKAIRSNLSELRRILGVDEIEKFEKLEAHRRALEQNPFAEEELLKDEHELGGIGA